MAKVAGIRSVLVNWFGSNLCILGPAASGKSLFWKFLTEQLSQIDKIKHRATAYQDVDQCTFKVNGKEIWISRSTDVGGREIFRKQWKALYKKSDIALYLCDGAKLFNKDKDYIDTVSNDLEDIYEWKKIFKKKTKLIIVINWCDVISEYKNIIPLSLDDDNQRLDFPPLNVKKYVRSAHIIAGTALDDALREGTLALAFQAADL